MANKTIPLFVTDSTNIRYLSGFIGSEPDNRDAYILLLYEKIFLFTNSLYIEQAKNLSSKFPSNISKQFKNIVAIKISRDKNIFQELKKLQKSFGFNEIAFENYDIKYFEFEKLKNSLKKVKLLPDSGSIEKLRTIKKSEEIVNIKQACRLTDECFKYIIQIIKPGISEGDISFEIEPFFNKKAAEPAFKPIVAFGAHSSMPHYDRKGKGSILKAGEIVLLDFGAGINGYCSDMTRVIKLKTQKSKVKTDEHYISAYTSILKAYNFVIDKLIRGERSGAKLDKMAKDSIRKDGFEPYSHSLGHNLGLDIHESPRLTEKLDAILKPGMVFTIEPAIYIEGKFGIRIEDTVLLTDNGIEILTKAPKNNF